MLCKIKVRNKVSERYIDWGEMINVRVKNILKEMDTMFWDT